MITVIRAIPRGFVLSYGAVADLAGSHRAARQLVRILHTHSEKENLPWHRVVNRHGEISLPKGSGYEEQKELLVSEGVRFYQTDRIDMKTYLWKPDEEWLSEFLNESVD